MAWQTYTTQSMSAKRTNGGAQLDVYTLFAVLLAHLVTTAIELGAVPRGSNCTTRGESRDIIGEADAERTVLQTEGVETKARDGANVADARLTLPPSARGEIDLLEKSQLADKGLGFFISRSPVFGGGFHPANVQLAVVLRVGVAATVSEVAGWRLRLQWWRAC